MSIKEWHLYFGGFLLLPLAIFFSYHIGQQDFPQLFLVFALFFGIYFLINKYAVSELFVWRMILLGLLLRVVLLFALPNLSDDYFRFVWDGRLIISGIHPLAELPSYYIDSIQNSIGLNQELYNELNSQNYFTVYPPVCQLVFSISCLIFPNSLYNSVVVMKLIFLLFETGSILLLVKLLNQFRLPSKSVLLYALCPLVILEAYSNLHFEIVLVFFVLLAIYLLSINKWQLSAIAMSLGIATKLLPLMFLPFLIKRLGWKRSIQYFAICGVIILALFTPLLFGFLGNFGESLNLYFQRFEFNGSIYYIVRGIGLLLSGYNLIVVVGPLLSLVAGGLILRLAYREANLTWQHFALMCLAAMTLFLFSTTTVHPWYLTSIIALCVLTRLRYPLIWSLMIMLTYANYYGVEYQEHLWLVGLEYLVVFGVLWLEGRR